MMELAVKCVCVAFRCNCVKVWQVSHLTQMYQPLNWKLMENKPPVKTIDITAIGV